MISRYKFTALAVLCLAVTFTASAQTPGTTSGSQSAQKSSGVEALDVEVVETGLISWSIDGCGSTSASCTTDVDKPAGATVRGAYMAAASTFSGGPIADGAITIDGNPVSWDLTVNNGFWDNSWADVTSIVKPIIDAAASGVTTLTIGESGTAIDGSLIVVVFDDPNVAAVSTMALMFGGQAIAGDTFSLGLADPFSDADQNIMMSLGISWSFQPSGQFSIIEVNGERLTTSAGGQDDGESSNGALFTVGGLGDDPSNPADPFAEDDDGPRSDDELYTLDALLDNGDNSISVFTENPSGDDNILFAGFLIGGTAAVVGEGITLGPTQSTNPLNTDHTVTARVQDDNGTPVSGLNVDFEIVSGPHVGLTGSDVTDADGEATFTWTGMFEGTDVVVATAIGSNQQELVSNDALKTWMSGGDDEPVCEDPSWDGTIVENEGMLFLPVSVPGGIVEAEFYNTRNLLSLGVFDAAFNDITGDFVVTGSGGDVTYTYNGAGPAPEFVHLKVAAESEGTSAFFVKISNDCTTIDIDPSLNLTTVDRFTIHGNYPNPFVGSTAITFDVIRDGNVTIEVYDMLGQRVRTLVDGELPSGRHEVYWDGTTGSGTSVASGVYLYRVTSGDQSQARRMTLIQ